MLPNTTTLEGASSPLFHFPWPFLDDVDEELFMSHNAPVTGEREAVYATNGATTTTRSNMVVKEGDKKRKHGLTKKHQQQQQQQQEKKKKKIQKSHSNKTGKKDRHSKICTAQGIRDRRMRLSLKVARNFFDLQDMLGFDKASKTIEWLLIHCRAEIQQLTPLNAASNKHISNGIMSFSASEESEVESEAKEMPCRGKRKRRKSCDNHVARESRDKARARARERTREKLMMIKNPQISKNHNLHQDSGNSSPQAQAQAPASVVGVMDELLGITRSPSSSTFSYNSPDFAPTIEPAPGCYAITSKNPSLQVQNIPNAMFQIYDKLPSTPSFMAISEWNPSSVSPTTLAQENPSNGSLQGILAFTPTTSNATFHSRFSPNHFL